MAEIGLELSNSNARQIAGGDEQARAFLPFIADVLGLESGDGPGKRIELTSDGLKGNGDLSVTIPRFLRPLMLSIMEDDCLLIHGGLVEKGGRGAILTGRSGAGKSTACRRIPPPWRALSDECTIIVSDGSGGYRAHPWLTPSRFSPGGPGGRWRVEESYPLDGIFVLNQDPEDRAQRVGQAEAASLLVKTTEQASGQMLGWEEVASGRMARFERVLKLARAVPTFVLHISLEGRFWEEIEMAMEWWPKAP